jgi:hypothetical protein
MVRIVKRSYHPGTICRFDVDARLQAQVQVVCFFFFKFDKTAVPD